MCEFPAAQVDVSGSPCLPWSRASGQKRLGRSHPLVGLLVAWCAALRRRPVLVALHENVVGFDGKVLSELLGDMYEIAQLNVSPAQIGFGFMERRRQYHILALRSGARIVGDIQALYEAVSARALQPTSAADAGRDLWRADSRELLAEENAVRRLRGWPPISESRGPSGDWTYLLTQQQQEFLRKYQLSAARAQPQEGPGVAFICDLGQNPKRGHVQSSFRLPTLKRSSNRIWSSVHRRWLLHRERAAAMGYAVYGDLSSAAAVPLDEAMLEAPAFTTGNAMHVANLGCVLVCALLAVETV